jgi:hypothetical protein
MFTLVRDRRAAVGLPHRRRGKRGRRRRRAASPDLARNLLEVNLPPR